MTDKVLLITEPDDSYIEGLRFLLFDLDHSQYEIFSQSLLTFKSLPTVIIYNSTASTTPQWTIDKIIKSDLILFNANSEHQQLVGYICSKTKSYYFGELRDLGLVNKSVIFDSHQLKELLEKTFETYGKI
jgi:hypothetical protein